MRLELTHSLLMLILPTTLRLQFIGCFPASALGYFLFLEQPNGLYDPRCSSLSQVRLLRRSSSKLKGAAIHLNVSD